MHVALAVGAPSSFFRSVQRGQQHGRQDGNDGDDHQKLNQRESAFEAMEEVRVHQLSGPV
jgi:hypothetical protein